MKFLVIGSEGSIGKRRVKCLTQLGHEVTGWDIIHKTEMPRDKYDAVIVSTPPDQHEQYFCNKGLPTFCEASVVKYSKDIQNLYPSCTTRFHPIVNQIKDDVMNTRPLHFIHHVGNYLPDWHPHEDYRTKYFAQKATSGCKEIMAFELCWMRWVFGECEVLSSNHFKLSKLEMDADDYYSCTLGFDGGVIGLVVIDTLARPTYRDFRLIYEGHSKTYDLQIGKGWEEVYLRETKAFVDAVKGESKWPYSVEADLYNLELLELIEGYNPKSTVW